MTTLYSGIAWTVTHQRQSLCVKTLFYVSVSNHMFNKPLLLKHYTKSTVHNNLIFMYFQGQTSSGEGPRGKIICLYFCSKSHEPIKLKCCTHVRCRWKWDIRVVLIQSRDEILFYVFVQSYVTFWNKSVLLKIFGSLIFNFVMFINTQQSAQSSYSV